MKPLIISLLTYLVLSLVGCSLINHTPSTNQSPTRTSASSEIIDKSGYAFTPSDTSCGGFPALKVQTLPETCLGMVVSHRNNQKSGKLIMKMPRQILRIPNTTPDQFLVTDMGGWSANRGGLFWLKQNSHGDYALTKILSNLDLPHGLTLNDRDGFYYLGENNQIKRFHFDPLSGKITKMQTVLGDMQTVAKHMHPLTHFTFDPKTGDLYVNSGAPNDHCFQKDGDYKKRCPDETLNKMASIQRISAESLARVTDDVTLENSDFTIVAKGLRNSMAMSIHPYGRFLIQGENSRDFPELEEPYEEMNVIRLDQPDVQKHFGWPYCYNNHAVSPEWKPFVITDTDRVNYLNNNPQKLVELHGENPFYCGRVPLENEGRKREYNRPFSLVPPHAAPLASGYYNGEMFSDLFGGNLLVSWHGHRSTGQRFVSYEVNSQGLPKLKKPQNEFYRFNLPNGCSKKALFNPRDGFRKHIAPYTEIISGWGKIKGVRPKGAPVGFAEGSDGSIWIVEDKNKTIVRLARSPEANYQQPGCDDGESESKDYNVPLLAWRNAIINDPVLKSHFDEVSTELRKESRCASCHGGFKSKALDNSTTNTLNTLDLFVESGWLKPGSPDRSLLYGALIGNGIAPQMPPGEDRPLLSDDSAGRQILEKIKTWIEALPRDVDKRWGQVLVSKSWNIRAVPTTVDNKPCGRFNAGDIAYIDPRPSSKIQNRYTWSKVYLVPEHSRLWKGACEYPEDGVFYIAQ